MDEDPNNKRGGEIIRYTASRERERVTQARPHGGNPDSLGRYGKVQVLHHWTALNASVLSH